MHRSLARLPNALSATASYVDAPDRREHDTKVNTLKSVAIAVMISNDVPTIIPLLLKANGSDKTPPPGMHPQETHRRKNRFGKHE